MVPEEITPLVPAVVGEKVADDQTCYILETLLKYMVIQVKTTTFQIVQQLQCGYWNLISSLNCIHCQHEVTAVAQVILQWRVACKMEGHGHDFNHTVVRLSGIVMIHIGPT